MLNWEGHNNVLNIRETAKELTEMIGEPLPDDAAATKDYQGKPRLIVPTVRTLLDKGESLTLKVIVLDNLPAETAELFYKQLGKKDFSKIDLKHVSRGVYTVTLPDITEDIEYYIMAKTVSGKNLLWPATATTMNQSIVVMP